MARHGGHVQLEQSDMCLALNMAKMAKEGFSHLAMEETQYLIKKPRSEVREEKKQGVEYPWRKKVKSARERHLAMLRPNHTPRCPPCPNGNAKSQQTR